MDTKRYYAIIEEKLVEVKEADISEYICVLVEYNYPTPPFAPAANCIFCGTKNCECY